MKRMSKGLLSLAVGIELVGIAVVSVGIGLELAVGGQIYFAVVTGGSVLVAAGGILFGKFLKR